MSTDLLARLTAVHERVAGARERGELAPAAPVALPADAVVRMIDHTLLKPVATAEQVRALCVEAREHRFAAVCVNPVWVESCARELRDDPVDVCSVVGFPLGAMPPELIAHETCEVIARGATEVDMVLNLGALKGRDLALASDGVAAVAEACDPTGVVLKVIIETALLTEEEKVIACVIGQLAGADFMKTSTGFGGGGATVDDVALMRIVVGPGMGVKAAGGIRTGEDALAMIAAGADRLGTSSGVGISRHLRESRPATGDQ